MTDRIDRKEVDRKRQEAEERLQDFRRKHVEIFEEEDRLRREVDSHDWPPYGYCECCHEDDDGNTCDEIFDHSEACPPEGWVEREYSCGCGGAGEFLCHKHATPENINAGRCLHCDN